MPESLTFPFATVPRLGEAVAVAPGIRWLRMPLPFALDHINLWLMEDGDGWTVVDTGIGDDATRAAWERVFAGALDGRPVTRLIVTHFHPDHIGLAGWLAARWGIEMWVTVGEWAWARALRADAADEDAEAYLGFYRAAGLDKAGLELARHRRGRYASSVVPIPGRFRRLAHGDRIDIGGRAWRVIVGRGHSVEHASLACDEARVLIAGDQVLPKITPHVSVWPQEPEGNPLARYLESLTRLRGLDPDALVLPSHKLPFRGLDSRLDALAVHHRVRLAETLAACERPATAVEVLEHLFRRDLDEHQLFFAVGESLAHLHYLIAEGRIERERGPAGAHLFRRRDAKAEVA